MIEKWTKHSDDSKCVGTILMDLSKAFDCIPHNVLIAKLHAYGLSYDALTLIYTYLKNRKQAVKINNSISSNKETISGGPQGSILGPILFNIFIKTANLHNYADDNSLEAYVSNLAELNNILEMESNIAVKWLGNNEMIANPKIFQAIILHKTYSSRRYSNKYKQYNNNITIDNELKFDEHINALCKKLLNN